MCLRTGPGDLKSTKRLKFDMRQIVYAFIKKNEKKKSNFPSILKIVSSTRLNRCMLLLSELGRQNQKNSIRLFCGGKSFTTILHFRFHCEILTIDLTAFVKDFFTFLKKNSDFY